MTTLQKLSTSVKEDETKDFDLSTLKNDALKKKKISISFKILAPVLTFLTISAIALILTSISVVKKHWIENAKLDISTDRQVVMDLITEELEYTESLAEMIGHICLTHDSGLTTTDALDIIFDSVVDQMDLEAFGVFDIDGSLLSPVSYLKNYEIKELVQKAAKGTKTTEMLVLNNNFIAISVVPILKDGAVIRVILAATNISTPDFMTRMPDNVGCEFTIIKDKTRLYTTIDGQQGTDISDAVYNNLKDGKDWIGVVKINGEDYIAEYGTYSLVDGISLFVGESVDSMNAAIAEIQRNLLLAQAIANIIILALVVFLLFKFVMTPLKQSNRAIYDLSTGDADLITRVPEKGNDELTELSVGVNQFMAMLQNMMRQITEKASDVNSVVDELGASSQQTASATAEIMANIDSVKNQAKNQVGVVDPLVVQISNAMDEQTAGSSQILEALNNMKEEAVHVDDSSKVLDKGIENIGQNMTSVSEISSTILGSMDEMAAGSQEISQATQNVSGLALKTKDAIDGINQLIGKFKI